MSEDETSLLDAAPMEQLDELDTNVDPLYARLKLAKYRHGTDTLYPPYKVKFGPDVKKCGYDELDNEPVVLDLIEMNTDLENSLKEGSIIQFRSGNDPEDDVKLVTADKTFAVQRVGYSNLLVLSSNMPERPQVEINEKEPRSVSCQGVALQYLEVVNDRPSVPALFKNVPLLPETVKFEELAENVQCSDAELKALIKEYGFCYLESEDDVVFRIAETDFLEYAKLLMQTYEMESYGETGFDMDDILKVFYPEEEDPSEYLIPLLPFQALIENYAVQNPETERFTIDKRAISDSIVTLLARNAEYIEVAVLYEDVYNTAEINDPDSPCLFQYTAEQFLEALNPNTILVKDNKYLRFIPIEDLKENPKLRFDQLFEYAQKWTLDDLTKFFKPILTKQLSIAVLANKFCRRITERDGATLYVLKNTA